MRQVHRLVNSMHPAEVASLLESLPPAQRDVVWDLVDPEIEGDVLVELNEEVRAGLIREMEAEELVAAAEGLEVDDLADLLGDLPETVNQQRAALDGLAGPRAPERRARLTTKTPPAA